MIFLKIDVYFLYNTFFLILESHRPPNVSSNSYNSSKAAPHIGHFSIQDESTVLNIPYATQPIIAENKRCVESTPVFSL